MRAKKEYENVKKRLSKAAAGTSKSPKEQRSTRFMNLNPEVNDSRV